jgi:hypothetical protein
MNIPQTWAALIDIGIAQKLLRMRVDERAAVLAEHDTRRLRQDNDNTSQQPMSESAASATWSADPLRAASQSRMGAS